LAASIVSAIFIGFLVGLHVFLFENTVSVYRVQRQTMMAVSSLLRRKNSSVKYCVPRLDLFRPSSLVAWSKIRYFLQNMKRRRLFRLQIHLSIMLFPAIILSIAMLVVSFEDDEELIRALFVFFTVVLVLVAIFILFVSIVLVTAAQVNGIEESHALLLMRHRFRVSEVLFHSDRTISDGLKKLPELVGQVKEEEAKAQEGGKEEESELDRFMSTLAYQHLQHSRHLLDNLIELVKNLGGSMFIFGVRVEKRFIVTVLVVILSAVLRQALERSGVAV
jgi:hypothetical protein